MSVLDRNLPLVAGLAFGGFGLLMIAVSAWLVAQGEPGGAAGAGVFGLVFCGAGFGVWRGFTPREGEREVLVAERAADGVEGRRYVRVAADVSPAEVEALQRGWASAPWTQRGDWAEGKVVQDGTTASGLMLGFTIAFNVIGWAVAALFLLDDRSAWPVLVFPAVGVALAVVVVRARLRRRKFGASVIECRTMPARLGDRFQGTVETGVPLRGRPGLDFTVRLTCVQRSTRRERVDGRTEERVQEEVLWTHEETVRGVISSRGPAFQLPLDLAIPDGLPATELVPDDDRTLWRLTLRAPDPGVDYAATFELPVYAR